MAQSMIFGGSIAYEIPSFSPLDGTQERTLTELIAEAHGYIVREGRIFVPSGDERWQRISSGLEHLRIGVCPVGHEYQAYSPEGETCGVGTTPILAVLNLLARLVASNWFETDLSLHVLRTVELPKINRLMWEQTGMVFGRE